MSKKIRGNGSHLSLDDRFKIEQYLNKKQTFKEIAKIVCKDPTTVSREVKKNRIFRERSSFNNTNNCKHYRTCSFHNVCNHDNPCKKLCSTCNKCNTRCNNFEIRQCPTTKRAPFVCNGCSKYNSCRDNKWKYCATVANKKYLEQLSESRKGINISEEALRTLNDAVSQLIKKRHSFYQIKAECPEITQSIATLYRYTACNYFNFQNIHLTRAVRYKQRKKKHPVRIVGYDQNRKYSDFLVYMEKNPNKQIVEMDTVEGRRGSKKCLMTLYFRKSHFMLIYLLEEQTQSCVLKVFNNLECILGREIFYKIFQIVLTDRGHEFQNPVALEDEVNNSKRTEIFYCNPQASYQKGGIEKNHQYIRYVYPKGSSFDALTQNDIYKLASHINSTCRASLDGKTPYEIFLEEFGEETLKKLKIKRVTPQQVTLSTHLFK